jgi:GntR family transcriptional regulator
VRKAIADLVHEGILFSRQGRGTFTTLRRVESTLERLSGFTESMLRLGRSPSTDVLDLHSVPASSRVAHELGIPADSDVYVVERLRRIDGEPAMLERCYLTAALVPDIDAHDLSGSLYALLAEQYGLKPVGGVETVVAVNADARVAQILDVLVAAPLLSTTRRTRTGTGLPVEYTLRHARGDMCSFRVGLSDASEIASIEADTTAFAHSA